MKFIDLLRMSGGSLFKRKFRTILTVLGVVIGTTSIIVMLSLGIGMKNSMLEQMESYASLTTIQVNQPGRWSGDNSSDTEQLFRHPLHPYTRALLSAIPQPNPDVEKHKVLEVYDPSCHHYKNNPPAWTEIEPGHHVLANDEELADYRDRLE